MKSLFKIFALSFALFATASAAQTMTAMTFENQWEEKVELNQGVKWLVLTQSKDAGKMVKEAFEELKVEKPAKGKLLAGNMMYLADISGMPGFITKMFAIPKMQDYAFPIALIKEDEQLANLKLDGFDVEKVTVLQLENLEVVNSAELADKAELVNKLKQIMSK